MGLLEDRLRTLLADPRVVRALRDPRAQRVAMRVLRLRGRLQGALDRRLQKVAGGLNLATQRDLRALQRRIRQLEGQLRAAEERFEHDTDRDRQASILE